MLYKRLFITIILFAPFFLMAQTSNINGVVKDDSGKPVRGAKVIVRGTELSATTDSLGNYTIQGVPYGKADLEISGERLVTYQESLTISDPNVIQISTVSYTLGEIQSAGADNIPTVTLNEDDLKDAAGQNVSSLLTASRDAYTSASAYVFSISRFRIRGYEDDNFLTYMNSAPMMDLVNGRSIYNTWTGLNDVVRSRESSFGLAPSTYSYGAIGGVYSIDSRASHQRKQLSVSYAASNRAYENRFMITYGSGVTKSGWSYSLSYSRRWAQEGFVPGTYYDGHSYFASVEKMINSSQSISLTTFGANTENARSGTATLEMFDIAGTNYYNPNWGYQNGEKRSAVVGRNYQPVYILNHDWKINERSSLETAVSFQSGKYKVSGLDWYNAIDPRPDYYRNLPSFDLNYGEDPEHYQIYSQQIDQTLRNNESLRQIQWDKLYEANDLNVSDISGIPLKWSKYIIQDRVIDSKRYSFNTIYNMIINDHSTFNGGLSYQKQDSKYYKQVRDLLGGDFFVDLNQFADQSNPNNLDSYQNDLNNPSKILHVGDKYGYDYVAHLNRVSVWGQDVLHYDRMDYFIAVELSNTAFHRTGNMRNGSFPNNSYGESATHSFFNTSLKGGATYKYNGRNYFFANAAYVTRAPLFENSYTSVRTRDNVADVLKSETIYSGEAGYLFRAPRLKARASAYYTQFIDGTDIRSFYHEDYKTFVNYSLTGIDKRHVGVEIGVDATLGKGFSANGVASIGNFYYTSRPMGNVTQDNRDTVLAQNEVVYAKNLHVAGGPQSAYTVGLNYRSPQYWYVYLSVNYFDNIYVDYNPSRRTIPGLDLVDPGSDTWKEILSQEKADPQMTVDISGGWSWRVNNKYKSLKKNTYIVLNLGITNLFNNEDLVTTAYEQLRFDIDNKDTNKFAPKYSYAFGTTFFASIAVRLN